MQAKTFSDYLRVKVSGVVTPIAQRLYSWGVSPDVLTFTGLLMVALASWRIAYGEWTQAAAILVLALPMDTLDGAVARIHGGFRPVGSFLDSTLDRYADALIFGSLALYYADEGRSLFVILALLALHGTLTVSYIRAKAESLNIECKVGLFTRVERLLTILFAWIGSLAFGQDAIDAGVWVLAIGTQVTSLQRLIHVARELAKQQKFSEEKQ
jgi:CDP-diacylglycerol---glycerol-3-phosphate 3-phosphatidyltransferase